jgi:glutathione S-transferase
MVAPALYADRGCPFAHRVLALLDELGVAPELRIALPGDVPDGLRAFSPTGRIPLLVHGDIAIGESRVMLEHLAEAYDFDAAFPRDLARRTRHRQAMALMDGVIGPHLFRAGPPNAKEMARLEECLDVLGELTADPPAPSLLAFHLAPTWLRFQWWRPESPVTAAIRARTKLRAWLDAAAALPSVKRTAPDAAENIADFEHARAGEKLPA